MKRRGGQDGGRAEWLVPLMVLLSVLLSSGWCLAQAPQIALTQLPSRFETPVFLTNAHDGSGRRFIIEQAGRIRVLQPNASSSTVFLDITGRVLFNGEQGLLGLTFHPQFSVNRRFFVNYTRRPDGATVVAEYRASTVNPNNADSVETVLFTIGQPFENHNGGMIEFGPDGFMYIGMGDGGSGNDPGNRAQNLNELLGKILRINVDVAGSAPEIFAYGFRNPWRFSFDRVTGWLWAGDVGQSAREEIDIVTKGGNYGWRIWEGTVCTNLGPTPCSAPGFTPPVADYVNTGDMGRCAIIGGYVYRGTQASLPYGAYIFGDLCSGEIMMLKDGLQSILFNTSFPITSFGEDESGELYVMGLDGAVGRISNPNALRASSLSFQIAGNGVFARSTTGSAPALTVGSGQIVSDPGTSLPSGMAIFDFRQQGILVSEATVPASSLLTSGRVFAEAGNTVNTGMAFVNPQSRPATVSFYFTDAGGNNSRSGSLTLAPNQQIAAFLSEAPFNGGISFSGTFTFTASLPIAAIALRGFTNERSEFLMTTTPVLSLGSVSAATIIPHFADGGGWKTRVILVNPSDAVANGTVEFRNSAGQVNRTASYTIQARSSGEVQTGGTGEAVTTGSVRVTAGASSFTILSFKRNGVTVTEAGVPPLAAGVSFGTYAENSGAVRSGIAIANPASAPAGVTLEAAGIVSILSIPPNGQRAFFLTELPEFANLSMPFQGVVRITSDIGVFVTSLRGRTNERGDFLITTTMPQDDSSTSPDSYLVIPHFADGAGYSMQFVLFGQTSSGRINFFNPSGGASNLLFQ